MPREIHHEIGREVSLQDKEVLFLEGSPWDGLYFIMSGVIQIFLERNRQEIILNCAQPGEFIGTATLVSQGPRMASARAMGEVILVHYSAEVVHGMLKTMPNWVQAVFKDITRCLRQTNNKLVYEHASAGESKEAETPKFPVKKILDLLVGLLWAQGARHCETDGKSVEILPLGDIGSWLEPVIDTEAGLIDMALDILTRTGVIQVIDAPRFGRSIVNPDRTLLQMISHRLGEKQHIPVESARQILSGSCAAELRCEALASLLAHEIEHPSK